jgi:succinate dehydrogenase/fumarate reductase flavoprotein subunit
MAGDELELVQTEVLIIGGGGAGMRAAIAAADSGADVTLITKGQAARSGATPMACPSYQAAFAMEDPRDSTDTAFEDTCYEGRYLGDENLIKALTSEATERAMEMLDYGVRFRTKEDGTFLQVVHPGHSYERNLVIIGNGYAMAAGLRRKMLKYENIRIIEDVIATRLLKSGDRIAGAVSLDMRAGKPITILAPAIILATGGYPELWRWTDTEPGLTGEGVYLAFEAGADLVDLEMMLFYPTGLCYPPEVEGTLVQYEGLLTKQYCAGLMLNGDGDPFLPQTTRLPVRDVMMKLMFREIEEGRASPHGGVYIDLRQSPKSPSEIIETLKRLDSLPYNQLSDLGMNILEEPIEVMPVTHYTLGGVRINEWAETTVPGLFAAGEVSGNIHGANRTSGNALAETQVFGARAGTRAAEFAANSSLPNMDELEINTEIERICSFLEEKADLLRPIEIKRKIKTVMHTHLHYQRSANGIQSALREISEIRADDLSRMQVSAGIQGYNYEWEEALEAVNMVSLAELVASAALSREESRGHHWRTDFPEMRSQWEKHSIIRRDGETFSVTDAPVIRLMDRTIYRREPDPALVSSGVLEGYIEGKS